MSSLVDFDGGYARNSLEISLKNLRNMNVKLKKKLPI